MWASIAKFVGGKTLTALLVVGSALSVIWFWRHPEQLKALWETLKSVLIWLGFVVVLPWSTFFVPLKVVRMESNAAAALMLVGYLVADAFVAFWLGGWWFSGVLIWGVLLIGFLAAAVYNFLVCDFLAERSEEVA